MNTPTSAGLARRLLAGLGTRACVLALSACASTRTVDGPDTLAIPASPTPPSAHIVLADREGQQVMSGPHDVVAKPVPSKVPASRVEARASSEARIGDVLTLQWQDAAWAKLGFEWNRPTDLRPFLAEGVVEFDVDALDMAHAGLTFEVGCGAGCGRRLPWVVPSRALVGQGWRHLSIALRCFARDGDDFSAVTQAFSLESSGSGEAAIANLRFVRHGQGNVDCPDYRTQSITPRPLEHVWAMDWWMPRHDQKLAEIATLRAAHVEPELVFIGDSITQGWEKAGASVWQANYAKFRALNLGFSGDHTENVLWRLQHGELDGIRPKVVVVMIGTNNLGERQEAVETTAAGLRRVLDEIRARQPQARILLLGLLPRDALPDAPIRSAHARLNKIIATFADERTIFFLDIGGAMTNADGTLTRDVMPDLLHPAEKGYAIWAAQMAPSLQCLLDLR